MESRIEFSNTNSLWGSFLAEVLVRLGVTRAVVAPGSRSAPLAIALARNPEIRAIPVLDERSASFYALGIAKRIRRPVALICTSGTAAANFLPAVIEARESQVPLLVLTADRPPELRDCASGQTIDQVKIFGHYPRWQAELALPEPSAKMLAYLRQSISHACERTLSPVPGPVHLNLPFRDPLAPLPDGSLSRLKLEKVVELLQTVRSVEQNGIDPSRRDLQDLTSLLDRSVRPLIVAGPAAPADSVRYGAAVSALAEHLGAPVLADVLSPVRQRGKNASVIAHYDALLAQNKIPELLPDIVLRLGPLPTSKRLRQWLETLEGPQVVAESSDRNVDPLHLASFHIRADSLSLAEELLRVSKPKRNSDFLNAWAEAEKVVTTELSRRLETCEDLFEGKIAWLLGRHLPAETGLFISNSTPVRDAEFFFEPREDPMEIFFNRGANGIDGIVSTALGIASEGGSVVLLTGELAFLHDQNGLLASRSLKGGLSILLINNGGGGIFRSLPVSRFDPPFLEFFLTPQQVDFQTLCAAHGIIHEQIMDWETLIRKIRIPWTSGVRVLEIRTDSEKDRVFRQKLLEGN